MKFSIISLDFRDDNALRKLLEGKLAEKARLLCLFKSRLQLEGVLLLHTCNRLELWAVGAEGDFIETLLRVLSLPILAYKPYCNLIEGETACIEHIFELACGLDSALFGEQLIMHQMTRDLEQSRICGCSCSYLEVLVRKAVETGRKVASSVNLQIPDPSVPQAIIEDLVRRHRDVDDLLVVGSNGQARLCARKFAEHGIHVTMTLRDIEKKDLLVPDGIAAVGYAQRFAKARDAQAVVCSTSGLDFAFPHGSLPERCLVYDLASPHDVEDDDRIVLVRPDRLHIRFAARTTEIDKARKLIAEGQGAFFSWSEASLQSPAVADLAHDASMELVYRMRSAVSALGLGSEGEEKFRMVLGESARKAFSHQLYRFFQHETKK
ncbi:MAG: hypothetical protein LKE40_00555 [Spirochaetia bacterium]|jgi:glutamyl-tRNA reductase|nr:hypothetical protein [Spirochaetia bacterium]